MRYLIITKKQITLAIAVVVCLTLAVITSVSAFAGATRKLPIYCVDTSEKKIAISFDAAWGKGQLRLSDKFTSLYHI